jgi:hypothetical protein
MKLFLLNIISLFVLYFFIIGCFNTPGTNPILFFIIVFYIVFLYLAINIDRNRMYCDI